MKRLLGTAIVLLPLAACASQAALKEQIAKTEEAQRELMVAQNKLDQVYSTNLDEKKELVSLRAQVAANQATEAALRLKLKENEAEIAQLKQSNEDLRLSANGKKGDVAQRLASVVEERDKLKVQLSTAMDENTSLKLRLRELRTVAGGI